MVNKTILIGNLGKDPEVTTLQNGTKVAKFSLATSESYKDKEGNWQDQTQWHNIVVWRQQAERAEKLRKGNTVYVEGKVTYRKWQDKEGNNRYSTEIVANYFRNMTPKDSHGQSSQNNGQYNAPATAPATATSGDDDLPF